MFNKDQTDKNTNQQIADAIATATNRFTPEELAKISALPVRKVKFSGQVKSAKYDKEAYALYMLDDQGVLTGEVRQLSKALPDSAPPSNAARMKAAAQATADKAASANTSGAGNQKSGFFNRFKSKSDQKQNDKEKLVLPGMEQKDEDENEEAPPSPAAFPSAEAASKKKLVLGLVLGGGALFLILFFVLLFPKLISPGTSATDPAPSADTQYMQVIRMTQDVIPGNIITESMLERVAITNALYNEIGLTGTMIYTWDKVTYLIGMYATDYVAAGQFLTHDDIVAHYVPPASPFILEDPESSGYSYLRIPVDLNATYLDDIMLGRVVDISLDVLTYVDRPEKLETTEVPGLQHSSSITEKTLTDTYKLKSMPVMAIDTRDGKDFFDTLSAHNAIPDGDLGVYVSSVFEQLYKTTESVENYDMADVMGMYHIDAIWVLLPTEQVQAIGELKPETTQVKITPCTEKQEPVFWYDTNAQKQFITESKYTVQVIAQEAAPYFKN